MLFELTDADKFLETWQKSFHLRDWDISIEMIDDWKWTGGRRIGWQGTALPGPI
jgi:hypothetical protein